MSHEKIKKIFLLADCDLPNALPLAAYIPRIKSYSKNRTENA